MPEGIHLRFIYATTLTKLNYLLIIDNACCYIARYWYFILFLISTKCIYLYLLFDIYFCFRLGIALFAFRLWSDIDICALLYSLDWHSHRISNNRICRFSEKWYCTLIPLYTIIFFFLENSLKLCVRNGMRWLRIACLIKFFSSFYIFGLW